MKGEKGKNTLVANCDMFFRPIFGRFGATRVAGGVADRRVSPPLYGAAVMPLAAAPASILYQCVNTK